MLSFTVYMYLLCVIEMTLWVIKSWFSFTVDTVWNEPEWNGNIKESTYRYTGDLLQLEQCVRGNLEHQLPTACTAMTSPLYEKSSEWSQCLVSHPDAAFAAYIMTGITNGFRIGHSRAVSQLSTTPHNLMSAMVHPEIVQNYLDRECKAGRLTGPFKLKDLPEIHCSPFGVIPKKGQDAWRLIVDLSSPKGRSVNDGIREELASLTYVTVDEVCNKILKLGQGISMAKTDVKSAFRIVPIHPSDRGLLGLEWNGSLFVDTTLPFGLRSAPKIFNAIADAAQFISIQEGIQYMTHYLDDFLILGRTEEECGKNLALFQKVCNKLGIPLAPEKTAGPSTVLEFLGIIIDTRNLTIRLPDRKKRDLQQIIAELTSRKSATKEELQSLAGKLQHATKVVKPGRCFIRTAYELASLRKRAHDPVRITRELKTDLAWWSTFLNQWQGTSLMWDHLHHLPEVIVFSDASGSWGCGALSAHSWIQHQWQPEIGNISIAHKELVPIVIACFLWGRQWSGKVVQFYCDNEAVTLMLKDLSSKEKGLIHLLRCVIFLAAKHSFWFIATHIPGKENILADAISRNNLKVFHSQAPKKMDKIPTRIPAGLPQLLYMEQPDWLSPAWTSQFSSFMQQD